LPRNSSNKKEFIIKKQVYMMSNEQRIEEMLHHAYERGYYKEVLLKVSELEKLPKKMDYYDMWEFAYSETKKEWIKKK
jgi:hypothetical protein